MAERVVVVGSFVVGVTVRLPRAPLPGETLSGDLFDLGPGGKGINLAVSVHRLGADVDVVAKVGEDQFADIAEELLRKEGIATNHLIRERGEQTGVGLVYLDAKTGENTIGLYPGANRRLTGEDVVSRLACVPWPQILTGQLEVPWETVRAAFAYGRRIGARTMLNPAPARELPRELLAVTDILTPNRNEIFQSLGRPVPAKTSTAEIISAARELMSRGVRSIVVTLGSDGALVFDDSEEPELLPPYPVTPVDTVGAGDAFNGGLAFRLAHGSSLSEAARFGAACGALATRRVGVIDALPRVHEVARLMSTGTVT